MRTNPPPQSKQSTPVLSSMQTLSGVSVLNAKCCSFLDGPMKLLSDTLELLAQCVCTERFEVGGEQNISYYRDCAIIVGREK